MSCLHLFLLDLKLDLLCLEYESVPLRGQGNQMLERDLGEGAASMIFCPQNGFSTGTDSMEGIRIQARLLRQVQALILNSDLRQVI